MKIAIAGSGGIGKSTLSRALADTMSLALIEENFDPLFQEGEKEITHTRFAGVLTAILEEKKRQEQAVDGLVTDRCPLDLMHVWMNNGLHLGTNLTEGFFAACRQQLAHYDFVVIPPWGSFAIAPMDEQQNSQQRNLNPVVQLRAHATIVGLAHMFVQKNRIIEIPQNITTVEARLQFVSMVIERRKARPK